MIAAALITLVLGDSIAVGTGQALHAYTVAHKGISSCAVLKRTPRAPQDTVVISAGSNDPPGACLDTIRERLTAMQVVWIVPQNAAAAANVRRVAAKHGDKVVTFTAGPDGVHPRSYATVARAVRHTIKQ